MSKKDKRIERLEHEVDALSRRASWLQAQLDAQARGYALTVGAICHIYGSGPRKEIHVPDEALVTIRNPDASVYRQYNPTIRGITYGILEDL